MAAIRYSHRSVHQGEKPWSACASAGDLPVLTFPGSSPRGTALSPSAPVGLSRPELPDPGNDDQLLSFWQGAFEGEVGVLDDMGARILPGMLSMLGESFASIVYPVLKILYRLPNEEWLDSGSLMSAFDRGCRLRRGWCIAP